MSARMMHVGKVFTDAVVIPDRLRKTDPAKVKALAESMADIGLQQPITVWPSDGGEWNLGCGQASRRFDLVTGYHRLLAAQSLGWDEIDCVFLDLEKLDRQLWEIDENLIRADLTDAERAVHVVRRAEIIKAKSELTAEPADNSKRGPRSKGQTDFVKDTAAKTGRSERSVWVDKMRGEKIAPDVMKDIKGTDIEDSGVQLDALAAIDHEKQHEAVKQVLLGHVKDVREVVSPKPSGGTCLQKKEARLRARFESARGTIQGIRMAAPMIIIPRLSREKTKEVIADLLETEEALKKLRRRLQETLEPGADDDPESTAA